MYFPIASPIWISAIPNTSGKSTYLRSVVLSVYLAQSLGVSCCEKIIFTPFAQLTSYINIPNIIRNKESLFEAELRRCIEHCQMIEQIHPHKYILSVVDELFTGTNYQEGIAASYAVCEYLSQFKNNLQIITTHFDELTKLENEDPTQFFNKKFTIDNYNGQLVRSFKIQNGDCSCASAVAKRFAEYQQKFKGIDPAIAANPLTEEKVLRIMKQYRIITK